jgi:F-type H+-transporting ATPase subunit b
MELDWSTFILEIINFLVLVWILQRFLYRPILGVIARRRDSVEKTLSEAQALRNEAETMKEQYQRRLSDWEQEKAQARETLQKELDNERARQSEQLQALLAQQREKNRVLEKRRLEELGRRKETAAIILASRFTRHLLQRLAGSALEARIIEVTLEELEKLPPERFEALRKNAEQTTDLVQVTTAYPLTEAQRRALQQALEQLFALNARYDFRQDPELIAGLRISVGPYLVRANLHEELQLFMEAVHADLRTAT